jgi:serine/threonine protein phosphatase PrpC
MTADGLRIRAAARTHVGNRRTSNEDAFMLGTAVIADELDGRRVVDLQAPALVAVADGMGGAPAGEVASRLVLEHLRDAQPTDVTALLAALESANAALFAAMEERPEWRGMGTTVAGILVHAEGLLAFGVGDCFVAKSTGRALRPLLRSLDEITASNIVDTALGAVNVRVPLRIECHAVAERLGRYLVTTDGIGTDASGAIRSAMLDAARTPEEVIETISACILGGSAQDNLTCIMMEAVII